MKLNRLILESLIREVIEEAVKKTPSEIDVTKVNPGAKDFDRADFMFTSSDAAKQAKAIKDPVKMIKRLKAVANKVNYELAEPFVINAIGMGFSEQQVNDALKGAFKVSDFDIEGANSEIEAKQEQMSAPKKARKQKQLVSYEGIVNPKTGELTGSDIHDDGENVQDLFQFANIYVVEVPTAKRDKYRLVIGYGNPQTLTVGSEWNFNDHQEWNKKKFSGTIKEIVPIRKLKTLNYLPSKVRLYGFH